MKLSVFTWLVIVIVSVSLVTMVVELDTRLVIDEPWLSVTAYQLISQGRFANPVFNLVVAEQYDYWPPFQTLLLAGTFRILGFGIEQGRLVSIFFSVLTWIAAYRLACQLYNAKTAKLALCLLAVNNILFVTSRTIRPEPMVAAFGAFALCVFLQAEVQRSWKLYILAGVIVGLGLLSHPNMLFSLAAIGVIALGRHRFSIFRKSGLWLFAITAASTLLPYLIYIVATDGENGFHNVVVQMSLNTDYARPFLGIGGQLSSYAREFQRYKDYVAFPYRAYIVLVELVALGHLWRRRRWADKLILTYIIVHLLSFALLVDTKNVRYMSVLMPFVSIALATVAMEYLQNIRLIRKGEPFNLRSWLQAVTARSSRASAVILLALMLYIANSLAANIAFVMLHRDTDYRDFAAQIEPFIPEDATIYGTAILWPALRSHPFYHCRRFNIEELSQVRPDILLLDSVYCPHYFQGAEKQRLISLLDKKAVLLGQVGNWFYGDIQIYALNW